jgi:Zn-dependent oligopeptidase
LPKEKIENLIASRKFMEAYGKLRQLIMTKFDFDLHLKNIKEPADF